MEQKINEAWVMYCLDNNGNTQYNIFTKAGNYRWGKIYHTDKYFLIVSWKAELTLEQSGEDIVYHYTPESGVIKIPYGVPNLFYYPEDCLMLEWFESGCEIEKFQRYRDMKK